MFRHLLYGECPKTGRQKSGKNTASAIVFGPRLYQLIVSPIVWIDRNSTNGIQFQGI